MYFYSALCINMKKLQIVIKIIIITICVLLSCSFLITMSRNIVNVGNVIGLIGCLIVILCLLLYNKYNKSEPLRKLIRIILSLAGVFALYCTIISSFIISGFMNTPQKAFQSATSGSVQQETVIVLGCKTINGVPSMMLAARLEEAYKYLSENQQAVCIVTGGQGADEIEPEAETMERFLITKGIEKDRIYKESKSKNTEENLLFSKEIIEKNDLSENVIIVSELYHVYRGTRNAEKLGLDAAALPAPVTRTIWALPSYWLREIFAISRDFAFDLLKI